MHRIIIGDTKNIDFLNIDDTSCTLYKRDTETVRGTLRSSDLETISRFVQALVTVAGLAVVMKVEGL